MTKLPPWSDPTKFVATEFAGTVALDRKLPDWNKDKEVRELVDDALLELERLDADDELHQAGQSSMLMWRSEIFDAMERDAIEAVDRKNLKPLAEMASPRSWGDSLLETMKKLRPGDPFLKALKKLPAGDPLLKTLKKLPAGDPLLMMLKSKGFDLGAKARGILAKRLTGELRFEVGRGKKTLDQRRADNASIGPAEEVPAIERILRHYYPAEKGIHDRAVEIAAHRAGINPETLFYHLNSRHRVRP